MKDSYQHPNVELRNHRFGKGVFVTKFILKDELVASFDGKIFEAQKISELPNNPPDKIRDHVVQFSQEQYRDSNGIARFINHSCNPDAGIKNLLILSQ